MLSVKECRLCKSTLDASPIFTINNLPLGVQYFPTEEEFGKDTPVSLEIFKCGICGFAQTFGNQVVYETENSAATSISTSMIAHKEKQAEDFISKYNLNGKKIIEAGCGDGHFLPMLKKAGASTVIGVEPSKESKESSTVKNDFTIYTDYVTKNNVLSEGPFDAFATFHVMEHLPDIHDFIEGISANLVEGGVGLVEVPSSELIENDFRFYDIINDHRNYFTLRTMRLAFEMHNFEVLESYSNWNGEHNVTIVRKKEESKNGYYKLPETIQHIKHSFNSLIAEYKAVSIWGASMHALTLLSQIDYASIQYIIDAAPYKQGRFTPITHIPIVKPEGFDFAKADLIIIVAPRFVDEIYQNLLEKYNYNGKIVILEKNSLTPKN